MKIKSIDAIAAAITVAALLALAPRLSRAEESYLPDAAASKIVTAVPNGPARSSVVILTVQLPAGDQPDPAELKAFGLLYTYQPRVVFVYRDRPTSFRFWNLQPDEHHDFMLAAPGGQILMKMRLPELKKTAITLTFHKDGLYTFYCTMHQPEMTGQIYVLPPPG